MKPGMNRYEASMKPPHHPHYLFLSRHSLQSYGSCIGWQWREAVWNRCETSVKPVWNTVWNRYEASMKPPHHPHYLFLCRHSLRSYGSCIGWQWREAVWNSYETGMKPVWNQVWNRYETGMKPVWNHHIAHTICFFVVTAYKAMAAALDGNGARRYETGMKPVFNKW